MQHIERELKMRYFFVSTLVTLLYVLKTHAVELESEEVVHAAAHVGASYLIANATGAICKKIGGGRTTCSIVGASVALAAGATKEYLDRKNGANSSNTIRSMGQNTVGVGLGILFLNVAW